MADEPNEELKIGLQEWMKAYLKDNLKVSVDCRPNWDYYSDGIVVDVELHLGEEVISDSSSSFEIPKS